MVAEVEPEPEPMVAEVEPEPEPMVAEVEPEPEPMVAEVEPVHPAADAPTPGPRVAPISETILHFPARPEEPAAPVDQPAVAAEVDSPELAARRAQLDLLGLGDPGEGAVTPEPPAVLPYRSRGATPSRAELAMRAGGSGFWEASAREVAGAAAQIGVQNCGECGLSLSATARFCRRCGTRQARSA
jgi:ribosomal protein L40E